MATGQLIGRIGEPSEPVPVAFSEEHVDQSDSPGGFGVLQDNGGVTYEYVGKFGGGGVEVHQIPVNFVSSSGTGMKHVADVPVPAGKQARVIVLSYSTSATTTGTNTVPHLYIGGNFITAYTGDWLLGATSTVTGPISVEANRRNAIPSSDPSFVGDIFWWEIDE